MACSPNRVSLTTTPNASPAVPAVVFMCVWIYWLGYRRLIIQVLYMKISF
ncbi:MAG: hypothetical protein GF329_00870 [Candidatus Lokiarchaeota archaeon]|nr:hypothetical protein [Candidatus Lokiarchaeota archaeon]